MASDADLSGWHDLLETFADANLPAPPIPAHLRPLLRRRGEWCWSTHPVDAGAMYRFDSAVESGGDDYAAVSHAGQGINSYGLNIFICTRALGAFLQFHWGGMYADPTPAVGARMLRAFAYLSGLSQSSVAPQDGQRHVIAFSDFRSLAHFDTVPQTLSLPGEFSPPPPFIVGVKVRGIEAAPSLDGLDWLFQGAARAWCDEFIDENALRALVMGQNLLVRWYRPTHPYDGSPPAILPTDTLFVEATEDEARALVWPRMTDDAVTRSRALIEQSRAMARQMGSMRPAAFLVSRDAQVIEPVICNYAASAHGGGASAFRTIAPTNVSGLDDVVRVGTSPPRGIRGSMWHC